MNWKHTRNQNKPYRSIFLQMEKALSWEIDDFSKGKNWIKSDNFSSGGCEW